MTGPWVVLAAGQLWRAPSPDKDPTAGEPAGDGALLGVEQLGLLSPAIWERRYALQHQTFALSFTPPRATSAPSASRTTCAYTALAFCPGSSPQAGTRQEMSHPSV